MQHWGRMGADKQPNFDEMHAADGSVRPAYAGYQEWLSEQDSAWMHRKGFEAESFFRRTGITFNVYGEDDAEERLIPFDLVPRIVTGNEWRRLSRGIEQRVRALNALIHDLYHRQEIIRSGRLPERLFRDNSAWLAQMVGFTPPGGVYTHIVGVDLVRTGPDEFLVLEDNARTPSGVSYMLENRETMMAMFPELFSRMNVRPVSDYPRWLANSLAACAPEGVRGKPRLAVLTPGIFNSAYFEHAFLADQMGVELVEPQDLFVDEGRVWMGTTRGPSRPPTTAKSRSRSSRTSSPSPSGPSPSVPSPSLSPRSPRSTPMRCSRRLGRCNTPTLRVPIARPRPPTRLSLIATPCGSWVLPPAA